MKEVKTAVHFLAMPAKQYPEHLCELNFMRGAWMLTRRSGESPYRFDPLILRGIPLKDRCDNSSAPRISQFA
jgi:hypothetical protein